MTTCDGTSRFLSDILEAIPLFLQDVAPKNFPKFLDFILNWSKEDNIKFQQQYIGRTYKIRPKPQPLSIEFLEKNVKSGDVFSCTGFSLFSSLIMVTAGGPVMHSAIAMWQVFPFIFYTLKRLFWLYNGPFRSFFYCRQVWLYFMP